MLIGFYRKCIIPASFAYCCVPLSVYADYAIIIGGVSLWILQYFSIF